MVVYTVATLAFFIMGVAVLYNEGRDPDGMRMVSTLATAYVPVFGEYARWLFLIGAVAVLYSTFLVATAGNARMWTDGLKIFGLMDHHNEKSHDRSITGLQPADSRVVSRLVLERHQSGDRGAHRRLHAGHHAAFDRLRGFVSPLHENRPALKALQSLGRRADHLLHRPSHGRLLGSVPADRESFRRLIVCGIQADSLQRRVLSCSPRRVQGVWTGYQRDRFDWVSNRSGAVRVSTSRNVKSLGTPFKSHQHQANNRPSQ